MKDRPSIIIEPTTGHTIALIGASKQGKSTLLMELYRQHFRDKYITILCSPTANVNPLYNDPRLIKTESIVTAYPLIEIAQQIQRATKNRYKFCFVFDDIIDQSRSRMLSNLILTMRNLNISTIISIQDPTLFSKPERNSINNICLFHFPQAERASEVCKNFIASRFGRIRIDDRVKKFQDLTRHHGFLHLDSLTGDMEKCRLSGY